LVVVTTELLLDWVTEPLLEPLIAHAAPGVGLAVPAGQE